MGITWSDLTEGPQRPIPPAGATTETSTIEVTSQAWLDEGPADDGGVRLVRTPQTETFSGGINGQGWADHLRVMRPDGSGTFVGLERVTGTVGGRHGSFALTCHGRSVIENGEPVVHGAWVVVERSATDELAGLRGRGEFTARQQPEGKWRAQDTFTYWFE